MPLAVTHYIFEKQNLLSRQILRHHEDDSSNKKMSSSPPAMKDWEESILNDVDEFQNAQIVRPLEDIYDDDDLESIQPPHRRNTGYNQHTKLVTDVEKARDLATTVVKKLEGAKIIQVTSSALEHALTA